MNKTVQAIIDCHKKGQLTPMEYVIEISHAVGMSGKTNFASAVVYAQHLLN